jgi:RNA polymerase sigma-70 factor (ECF subfamily)
VNEARKQTDFQKAVLPHLDAAYRLARWLVSNDHDAEDVTQDAYLRAWRFFGGFRGGDGRTWLLAIVRNAAFTRLRQRSGQQIDVGFDEELHSSEANHTNIADPAALAASQSDCVAVRAAIEQLPVDFREVIALREIEELSYKEIADIADIPIGTVMSRLARGRSLLAEALTKTMNPGNHP